MKSIKPLIISIVISIVIIIVYIYMSKSETYTTVNFPVCKNSDIVSVYNNLMASINSADMSSIDPQTMAKYTTALETYKTAYNNLPDCTKFADSNSTYNNGTFVCSATKPVASYTTQNGLVCSENDITTSFDCIPGTNFIYSTMCVNGKTNRTRSGDIPPLNGGKACPAVIETVSCSDCVLGTNMSYSSCVNGKSTQTRSGDIPPVNGGKACPATTNTVDCANCVGSYQDTCIGGKKAQSYIITPAYNGGSCNLTPKPDIISTTCCNSNFIDNVNCSGGCISNYLGENCNLPIKQIFTSDGEYPIPPNVTELTVTLIGGGGACGWGTSYCSETNIDTLFSKNVTFLNGDPGSVVKFTVKPYQFKTFKVAIGKGGMYTQTCLRDNGFPTYFYLGSYSNVAFGGLGGSNKNSLTGPPYQAYDAANATSYVYKTGYGYGDGQNSSILINNINKIGTSGDSGAVIINYKYNDSIPQTIATSGYIEKIFTYTGGDTVFMPIPDGVRYIAFVAAGGGGGGWYGGVSNYANLPTGKGYPSNFPITYSNGYVLHNGSLPQILYGGPPGSGGAAAPAYVCSGKKTAIFPPNPNGNKMILDLGTNTPSGVIGFYVGKGGTGAVPGGAAGNGEATAIYIRNNVPSPTGFNGFFPGGMGATGPTTPGTGANWNWGASFPFMLFPKLGNMPNAFDSKISGASGKTRTTIDANGVYVSKTDSTEQYQHPGVEAYTGGNGGAFTYTDAGWGSIFGTVTNDVYDYFDPNGTASVKNGLPGCGGRGGDAYIYEPDGKDKGVDPTTLKGYAGGNGGDGFIRMFFMKEKGFF